MSQAISRESFDELKNYLGVYLQQGRVILDSDWNESQDVAVSLIRRASREAFGDGSPNTGFAIDPVFPPPPQLLMQASHGTSGGGSLGSDIAAIAGACIVDLITLLLYVIFGPILFFLNFRGQLLDDCETITGWSLSSAEGQLRLGKDRPYQGNNFVRLSGHPGTVDIIKTLANVVDLSAFEIITYRYRLNHLTPGPMKFFLEDDAGNRSVWDRNNPAFATDLWLAGFAGPLDLSFHVVTDNLSAGIQGQSYSVQLTAFGGTTPITWTATGLPAGITFSLNPAPPAAWQANKAYVVGNTVTPNPPNGHFYSCSKAGTSGAAQPAFPTGTGQTVNDNTVTWTESTPSNAYRAAQLSGTPTANGNLQVTIKLTDAANKTATKLYSLQIQAAAAWQANKAYNFGDIVFPTPTSGNVYSCTKAGTSGAAQPAFPTSPGQLVSDGTVVWTEKAPAFPFGGSTDFLYLINQTETPTGTPANLTRIKKYGFTLYQDPTNPLVWDIDDLRLGNTALENQAANNNFIVRGSQYSQFLSQVTLLTMLQTSPAFGGGSGGSGGTSSGLDLSGLLDLINTNFQLAEPSVENAGRFYVAGYPCLQVQDVLYSEQADPNDPPMTTPTPGVIRQDSVFLDVWTESVTYVDDPAIREIALGGPDTTTRLRARFRVRVNIGPANWQPNHSYKIGDTTFTNPPNGHYYSCTKAGVSGGTQPSFPTTAGGTIGDGGASWQETPAPGAVPVGKGFGRGTLNTEGSYIGQANRFYRVEIDKPGNINAATFRWSEDNASTIQRVIVDIPPGSTTITVEDASAYHPGDFILIRKEFGEEQHRIASVFGNTISLQAATGAQLALFPAAAVVPNFTTFAVTDHPRVERWNAFGVPIIADPKDATVSAAILLNDGVQVRFGGFGMRKKDYWNFTTRYLAGDQASGIDPDTRIQALDFAAPHGVAHYYAPLALITRNGSDPNPDQIFNIKDRRQRVGNSTTDMSTIPDVTVTGTALTYAGGATLVPASLDSQFLVFWSGDLFLPGAPPANAAITVQASFFNDAITDPSHDAQTGKIQDRTLQIPLVNKPIKTDIPVTLLFAKSDTSFLFLPNTFVPTSVQVFIKLDQTGYTVQLTNMRVTVLEMKKSF